MEKVLVMGGSYFIGKKIAQVLLEYGYEVTLLNRGTKALPNPQMRQIICDRNDVLAMQQALAVENFDIVVDVCGLNRSEEHLLCKSLDCSRLKKFVFISSSAVYDVERLAIPFPEEAHLAENSYWTQYGTDKIEAEEYLTGQFCGTDTELIILRPPYIYGEDNYLQRESFIFEHICSHSPVLLPVSNPKLQFLYTGDLAGIVVTLLKQRTGNIAVYNVGNREAVTSEEWVKKCGEAAGCEPEIFFYDYKKEGRGVRDFFPFPDYDNVLEVSKIKMLAPSETDFVEGLKHAYDWFLGERENIVFKKNVTENEHAIFKNLSKFTQFSNY